MSTRRRRDWTPYGMPHILVKTRELSALYASYLRASPKYSSHPGLAVMDANIALMSADPTLYWMNAAAVDTAAGLAARGVPNHTTEEVLASSGAALNGFLCFEKPIGTWRWEGVEVPLDGLVWGPVNEPGRQQRFKVDLMSRVTGHRDRISDLRRDTPLVAVNGLCWETFEVMWQTNITPTPGLDYVPTPQEWGRLTSLIASVLLMLGQPRMVSQRLLGKGDGVTAPSGAGGGTAARPEVVLIDLLRPPRDSAGNGTGRGKREHDYRWWVIGHWKTQPHGRGNSLRKIIYVEPHTRGPADKPLTNPVRVNVIRPDHS